MRIGDIMSTKVETIDPAAPAEDAWRKMRALRVHHLVVTDGRRIAGVISDRDLGGTRVAPAARAGRSVRDLMTPDVTTIGPRATVREVANLLRGNLFGCVPVVDGQKLVGIVTITDLLDLVGRGAERPVEMAKRWTLKHRGPRQQKLRRPR